MYVPGIPKAGGFTITSAPSKARVASPDGPPGHVELAVQRSPENPPAAWLWREPESILGSEIEVRVGGNFVWPPPGVNVRSIRKVVFVAGGVGVNPLMSIVDSLAEKGGCPFDVRFLYSMKDPGGGREADKMLFVERLAAIFGQERVKGRLSLFLTGSAEDEGTISCKEMAGLPFCGRRMTVDDVAAAIGDEKRFSVIYVCGVPLMTDGFVRQLTSPGGLGLEPHKVLHEKWW